MKLLFIVLTLGLTISNLKAIKLPDRDTLPRFYYARSKFENYPNAEHLPGEKEKTPEELKRIAQDFVVSALQLQDATDIRISHFSRDGDGTVHWKAKAQHEGVIVSNANASINMDKYGNVLSSAYSWINLGASMLELKALNMLPKSLKPKKITPIEAVRVFGRIMKTEGADKWDLKESHGDIGKYKYYTKTITGAPYSKSKPITVQERYYNTPSGQLRKVWSLLVPMKNHIFNAYISEFDDKKVYGIADWASRPFAAPRKHKPETHRLLFKRDEPAVEPKKEEPEKEEPKKEAEGNQPGPMDKFMGFLKENKEMAFTTIKFLGSKIYTMIETALGGPTNPNQYRDFPVSPDVYVEKVETSETTISVKDALSKSKPYGTYKYTVVPLKFPKAVSRNNLIREGVVNPAYKEASPLGWHNTGTGEVDATMGNNVVTQENWTGGETSIVIGKRPHKKNFDFTYLADDKTMKPPQYMQATATNVFYLTNYVHDLLYVYGFDEASGNFQNNNFSKGGKGGDAIIANIQDGSGTDNANFLTQPDGAPGIMNMFVFNSSKSGRDGGLDSQVVIHEIMHGVSNRLTGGANTTNCLENDDSAGMNEGWSDFLVVCTTASKEYTRDTNIPIGAYAVNNEKGARSRLYSTNLKVNNFRFSDAGKKEYHEVHILGEIWMSFLYELYWNFVDAYGFSDNLREDYNSGKGNTKVLQLVIDGLKNQPCNPTFTQARDSMIQVDNSKNGGKDSCLIWRAFAKRGMGLKATDVGGKYTDDFTIPEKCGPFNAPESFTETTPKPSPTQQSQSPKLAKQQPQSPKQPASLKRRKPKKSSFQETIVTTSYDDDGEVLIEGYPVGSPFIFIVNAIVSMSFDFIGFLLTTILASSHAARCGSRMGLGATFLRYGLYIKTKDVDEELTRYKYYNPETNETTDHLKSQNEWMAYLLMVIGFFLVLHANAEYYRASKLRKLILSESSA